MDQRISFLTLAVRDLDASRRFYVDGLGWTPELEVEGDVVMILAGDKLVLSLWDREHFQAEVGPIAEGDGVPPFTISHNVATEAEVDAVLAVARDAGADPVHAPVAAGVGRLHRLLRGPGRLPLGDRHQPRTHRTESPAMITPRNRVIPPLRSSIPRFRGDPEKP